MLKITLFCVAYLLIKTDVVWCKPDYFFRPEAVGWFKVHRTPETWQEALLKCHYEGAVLASPLNEALANALNLLCEQSFGGNSFFLGTQDLFSRGDFLSVEGVLLSHFEIKSELREMGNGRCLTMSYTSQTQYELRSTSCEDLLPYICYRRLDNQTLNQCGTFDNEYRFNEYTGSCYKVHPEKHTWNRAHRICVAEGGDLVILNDNEEARIVRDMFPESPILQDWEPHHIGQDWEPLHIGLLAWGEKDHTWMTVHGEKIEDVYHAWIPGQDNDQYGDQLRATLLRSGGLGVASADTKAIFVCEKSPDSIRFETPPLAIEYEIQ